MSPFALRNEYTIPSPSLIFYREPILQNLETTIALAGGAARLWPHIKSHKCGEMLRLQMQKGIHRFKCATWKEAELAARCGAEAVVWAYPLVGPNVETFTALQKRYPQTDFFALGDSLSALKQLNDVCENQKIHANWLCDINMGMNRTGVSVPHLPAFLEQAVRFPRLHLCGVHAYDGQNHVRDPEERKRRAVEEMDGLFAALGACGHLLPEDRILLAGGSPTFSIHAERENVYVSPGTVFLWDAGYASAFPDLPFQPAAAVLSRVVSVPEKGVFTLDAGYKAVSSDQPVRGVLPDLPHAVPLFQSEEHWTWRMAPGEEENAPKVGETVYILPGHICSTVHLYDSVWLSENGTASKQWTIEARGR